MDQKKVSSESRMICVMVLVLLGTGLMVNGAGNSQAVKDPLLSNGTTRQDNKSLTNSDHSGNDYVYRSCGGFPRLRQSTISSLVFLALIWRQFHKHQATKSWISPLSSTSSPLEMRLTIAVIRELL
ncbi:uncharacterized protein KZ484_007480 [Pholidichthys leucotaenia]